MLPAVPLEAVEDPTVKVLPPWVMLILAKLLLFSLPPVPVEKAEMLQDGSEQSSAPEFSIKPVARKLPPAVMAISPPFLPSVLIELTWMLLLALRVTRPPSVVRFVLPAMLLAA
jgi:hypothetical protein